MPLGAGEDKVRSSSLIRIELLTNGRVLTMRRGYLLTNSERGEVTG